MKVKRLLGIALISERGSVEAPQRLLIAKALRFNDPRLPAD